MSIIGNMKNKFMIELEQVFNNIFAKKELFFEENKAVIENKFSLRMFYMRCIVSPP